MDDASLQNIFILHLLTKLGKPEMNPERRDEWVEEIYAVLAVMPCSPGGGGSGQLEALCETLWASRGGTLKEERVLSSLLRPRSDALVSAYCSAALRLQRDRLLRSAPDTQGAAESTHHSFGQSFGKLIACRLSSQAHLPESEKLALSLCCHGDRPSAWQTIYFECLSSGKHFLELVLVGDLKNHHDREPPQVR